MNTLNNIPKTRKKMSQKVLGFDVDTIGTSRFIVTNIKTLFDAVVGAGSIMNDFKGFYHSCDILIGNDRYLLILLTPGNVIIDILKLVANSATSITLLGLCGSLNPRYPVASVVAPEYVADSANPTHWEMLNTNGHAGTCICQVDGLVQTDDFYWKLQDAKIDFVDMESFFLKKHLPFVQSKTISVVSDMPLVSPFYEDNPVDIDINSILLHL